MSLRKVADFRIAQRQGAGYVLFKLINPDNSITNWIGWQYVPPGQLGSLHGILMTGNAYYNDVLKIFVSGPPRIGADSDVPVPVALPKVTKKATKKAAKKSK